MDNVCDPQKQPTFPTAPLTSYHQLYCRIQNSHQNTTCIPLIKEEKCLQNETAKRIKKDKDFTETFFKPTGETSLSIKIPSPETTSTEDSEEEEESEETLQQRVQLQHRRQRKLRHRILRLLNLVQSLE